MAHTHDVYDMENHFEINGSSRFIKETSETKLVVVQGDHKSEVLTFKMPRYIDGHDMTLCNKIRIHYINLDTKTNNKSADVYEVTDLTLCEECEDVLTFTWTIEAPATKYSGTLSFLVKFECTEGENVLYQWNTAKYVSVNVLAGIDNSEEFVEKYSNVLEEWYNELTKGADSIEELNQQAIAEIELAKEDAKEDIQGKANSTMAAMNQFSSNAYDSFKNDVNEKAEETLASIPDDYTTLAEEVSELSEQNAELKSDLSQLSGEIGDVKSDLDKLNEGGLVIKDEVIAEDINNWLDEHPEATTTVQDGVIGIEKFTVDVKEKLSMVTENTLFLAPLTQMSKFGSSCCLGLSKDGLCFNPIPGTENFCDNKSDIQVFEYKGHYLFACTTSSTSDDNNIDLYAGWTDDFETYHFENTYLGFSQYRDSEYPDGLHHIARWTPRFYMDKDGNLNILVSMVYNSAISKDIYEMQSRSGYFAIFHQTVEFKPKETGFLTGKGDISKFDVKQDGVAVSTFFDGEMIYNNGVYYFLYNDCYFNDVCVATSTDDYGEFITTKKNIFEAFSSEAPCVVKCQNGWFVYGQQYASNVTWQPRNLLLYTKDFYDFKAIGFPKRNLSNIRKDGAMRNLSSIQIRGEIASKLYKKCGVLNEGGYNNGEIQTYYYQSKILDCIELAYNNGRAISPFENSWFAAKSVDPLHMNNLWNASTIYFFGLSTQQIFNINYSIGTKKDRVILCGDYTSCSVMLANTDDTQSISRRINRGNIDNFFVNKDIAFSKSSGITGEVHIFNTLIASMIVKNVSSANTWSAGEVVGTLPVYPHENNSVIFGMITATNNHDLPVGTTVPFYLKNDGTLVAVNDTPPQHWTVNTTFQMRTDFYNTLI